MTYFFWAFWRPRSFLTACWVSTTAWRLQLLGSEAVSRTGLIALDVTGEWRWMTLYSGFAFPTIQPQIMLSPCFSFRNLMLETVWSLSVPFPLPFAQLLLLLLVAFSVLIPLPLGWVKFHHGNRWGICMNMSYIALGLSKFETNPSPKNSTEYAPGSDPFHQHFQQPLNWMDQCLWFRWSLTCSIM